MKKLISVAMIFILMVSAVACVKDSPGTDKPENTTPVVSNAPTAEPEVEATPEPTPEPTPVPVWECEDVLDDDKLALFEKGMEGMTGVSYEPIAYLGSILDAEATTHCFACKSAVVYPDAVPYISIVLLDENGSSVDVRKILILDIAASTTTDDWTFTNEQPKEMLAGGWFVPDDVAVSEGDTALILKALNGFEGSTYEAVAHIGSQVVAGMNECYLCRAILNQEGAKYRYVIMYVYDSLDGAAQITKVSRAPLKTIRDVNP